MICNSCFTEIIGNGVKCSICNKDIHAECAINDGGIMCDNCYLDKEKKLVTNDYTFEVPSVIRRSYIEKYKSCPFKFYKQVIEGIEMPPNIYTQLGIDLHDLFDKASNDSGYLISDMMEDYNKIFKSYPKELFDGLFGKNKPDDMYKRGVDSIETFYKIIQDMPKPFKTEETLQFNVGEDLPIVQATPDRINMIDGKLHVMDWKTGNVMTGMKLSNDLQAPLYIYSIQQKYNLPVETFTFYYLKDAKERIYIRTNDDNYVCKVGKREYMINITDAIREVQHIFSQIKKVILIYQ